MQMRSHMRSAGWPEGGVASGPGAPVVRYATRNHALVPATTWVLDGAGLRLEDDKGPPREIPLGRVQAVRLDFAPTRPERNRFRCRLTLRTGETLTFFNRTYAGLYDFRETNPDYVAFVRTLLGALQRHAPACRFLAGATEVSYFFNVLATGFIFVCLGAIAWFLFRLGLTWMIAVKLLLVCFYLPTLFRWVGRNRPRSFAPAAIPVDLLPAVDLASPVKS